MVSKKFCVVCECSGGVMKPVRESLVPTTVASPAGAVKDVWTIFLDILTVSEDESLNQICIDCFGEVQRTYYFVDKCEKAQLKLTNAVSRTVEKSNETPQLHRLTKVTIIHEFPENLRLPVKLNRSNSFPELRNSSYEKESLIEREVSRELNESHRPTEIRNVPEELPPTEQNVTDLDTENNASATLAGEEVEILWSFTVNAANSGISRETGNTGSVSSRNNEGDVPIRLTAASFEQSSEESSKNSSEELSVNISEEDESFQSISSVEEPSGDFSEDEEGSEDTQYTRILRSRKDAEESGQSTPNQTESRDNQTGKENSNLSSNRIACAICLKSFRNKQNLRIHLLLHAKISPFECCSCSKCFRSETELKLHMRRAHSAIKRVCTICSKEFNNVKLLTIHLKTSTCESKTKPQLKCSICFENFDSKSNLSQHLLTHNKGSDNSLFTCNFCPKQYPNEGKLKIHLLCHSNERTINCYRCSKNFKYPQSLREHIKSTHPELKHCCEICLHRFEKVRQLRLHKAKLHKHKCNICLKYFQSISSLDEHIRKQHPCRFCDKMFNTFLDFKKHMQAGLCIPDNKKDRQCFKCWKIFGRKIDLSRHLVVHTGDRAFKCDRCSLAFARKDSLNRHKKKMHDLK